jgi:hypothetical protein
MYPTDTPVCRTLILGAHYPVLKNLLCLYYLYTEEQYKQSLHNVAPRMTYSEYVFVTSVIQHAKRMRRIAICSLTGCNIFLYIMP